MAYPKIGLALGSGGARGLAHIGVLKILEKNTIPIHAIAGSSIGALIGAYYALHPDIQQLEAAAFRFSEHRRFELLDITLKGGLIKGNRLETAFDDLLNQATFKDLEIPFIAVATDYHSGDTVSLQTGNIAKALRASISVPAFLQPVEYHNRLLADGGLSDPVPADIVRQMGVDIVIAINLDMVPPETEHITIPSIHVVPAHAIDILQHHLALRSVKSADVVIAPDVAHIGWVGWDHFFNQTKTQKLIATGEEATLAAIPQIKEIITLKKKGQPLLRRVLNIFH